MLTESPIEFATYVDAVETIARHLADRDEVVVTGDIELLTQLALDRLADFRVFLDNGTDLVLVARSPELPRVFSALLPSNRVGAVLTIPKTVKHTTISRVLREHYPSDGSCDIVMLQERESPLLWPRLFVDALSLVDPRAAATLRANDVRTLS